ncbi:MAG TPA: [FeFe] hydrogenase H-cluster radical SAM maturase HydE [Syntrophorhabdaceae bacterium]|nr:[FeFe] hydrogenase H-cluster radical SAM maturase HydE [Syntrophorhabdaceae bacterium]HOL04702.1 [FeFe] hydrogenase H-cluster radical SAM maturase HydE [Syntrophorhabdaceae bacterium]HON85255.1 [FeFe] hydrogenase H-cluster radical SAM maturase HydE [Syntrophorhabdaceae bacterium]HOT42741.1 [FeFe] hydrogenase H-cluster radical SAM maturase HydE [Syntrophorhabdaceae bacterium]HPC66136.1 [FeFe] hydrogenase H-cluster radical SAM maturase HydE [Syntrophorhabdaceae bacterium]
MIENGRESKALKDKVVSLLKSKGNDLTELYEQADHIRKVHMGDEVYIRGIIEFSNICNNDCLYCGIRASNHLVNRYTMTLDEILAVAREMPLRQQTTVVLQSGETPGINDREIGNIIKMIKAETSLAVTVSVGNRPREIYRYWQECGMDRYFLRFETSDPVLFARLHPDCTLYERLDCLYALKELGVQTGSGFMIGLPGETLGTLADNILLCRDLDLDMIGIGPFIPHPDTPLADEKNAYAGEEEMFFKALAVLRLFNPDAHIPATTAFDAVFPGEGRNLALKRGANVFMPNNTPVEYRKDYLLYPGKPCIDESAQECSSCVLSRIESIGRKIGLGPGHSVKMHRGKK